MSSIFKQTLVLTRANLMSLHRRAAIAASMALSVALVVCVLAGFLSMAAGFQKALTSAGSQAVAIILGGGTNQESGSDIPADAIRRLAAIRADIGVARNEAGILTLSREIVTPVEVRDGRTAVMKTLALRGMDPAGPFLRDGVVMTAGRFAGQGAREIVVGKRLALDFPSFAIGSKVRLGSLDWTVVGHFSAGGNAFESEIWADLDAVRSAFDRLGEVQSVRLRLDGKGAIEKLRAALLTISTTPLVAVTEADLFAGQSTGTTNLIRMFGWPIALLLALGATAGALNTMMSSVSDRTMEIATVRALGFSRLSAFLATWAEAAVLAAVGLVLGLAISWLAFNGWQASTVGANSASISFQLTLDASVMLAAGILGLAIGMVGGALPAFHATRLPLTAALRAKG